MTRKSMWFTILSGTAAVAVVSGVWLVSNLMSCKYRESGPTYSADQKYYYQMQVTLCTDHTKSRVHLMMGIAGRSDKFVLLDLGPRIGEVQLSWHEGPRLVVQVPRAAIIKQYGPYTDLPQIEYIVEPLGSTPAE
jgi:hypothetical protein